MRARETLLLSTFLISMSVLLSSTFAAVVEVALMPVQTIPDNDVEFSLSVKNLAGANVNEVEIVIPQENGSPTYLIKEIGNPAGWTYESRYALAAPAPFKVIWSTADSGIAAGKSISFNFVVSTPDRGSDYNFEWKAADLNDAEDSGVVKVENFNPTLTSFSVNMPSSMNAGREVDLIVTALDQQGNKKTDYTGTVGFASSDPLAILPANYKFTVADKGVKTFKVMLKTAGEQHVSVVDGGVSESASVTVQQSDVSSIELTLGNGTVETGMVVSLTVRSTDLYGNTKDISKDSTFEIDKPAKGKLSDSTYTAGALGKWTIVATYMKNAVKFSDGAMLTVVKELPKPAPVNETETEPEKEVSMSISSNDLVEVEFNTTKLFTITVKNTGEEDLSNVSIYFSGYPEKWLSISPSLVAIDEGKSQRFTVTVSAPEHIEASDVEFVALSSEYSSEKLSATKIIKINVTDGAQDEGQSNPLTGRIALSRNLTYLGIAIVVAVILIVLFWLLFLKEEPKKKKSE